MGRPFVIGLTGSIGTGKSTTAGMFRDLGIPVWDADETVRRLYDKGGSAIPVIADRFPEAIVDGKVSREALKAEISKDASVLGWLDQVIHPLVRQDREAFIQSTGKDIVLLDIPLLFETGAHKLADMTIVVTIDEQEQKRRVLERGSMTEDQLAAILAKQMPSQEKAARADVVIVTTSLEDVAKKVASIVQDIRARIR